MMMIVMVVVSFSIRYTENAGRGEIEGFAVSGLGPRSLGNAVSGIGEHLIYTAAVHQLENGEETGALVFVDAGAAADRIISKNIDDRPALGFAPFPAHHDLIFDRPTILKVA